MHFFFQIWTSFSHFASLWQRIQHFLQYYEEKLKFWKLLTDFVIIIARRRRRRKQLSFGQIPQVQRLLMEPYKVFLGSDMKKMVANILKFIIFYDQLWPLQKNFPRSKLINTHMFYRRWFSLPLRFTFKLWIPLQYFHISCFGQTIYCPLKYFLA